MKNNPLSGEWWIDDSGNATYADGDVGADMAGHAQVAFSSALEVDLEDPKIPAMMPHEMLSEEAIEYLKEHDAPAEAIEYLADGSDPRDYMMHHKGWVRVAGHNFQMEHFDDETLERIKGSDIWNEADDPENVETSDETITLEEMSTGWVGHVALKVFFKAASAAALRRYVDGVGKWRNNPPRGVKFNSGNAGKGDRQVKDNPPGELCLTEDGLKATAQRLDAIVNKDAPALYSDEIDPIEQEARAILITGDASEYNPVGEIELMNDGEDRPVKSNPFIKGGPDVFLGPYVVPSVRKLSRVTPRTMAAAKKKHKYLMSAPFLLKALRTPGYVPAAEELGIRADTLLRTNAKMEKSELTTFSGDRNFYAPGLALAPHVLSYLKNLCMGASPGCAGACLNRSGQGDPGYVSDATNAPQEYRKRSTLLFLMNPVEFKDVLFDSIERNLKYAQKKKLELGIRLNVLSDYRWEAEGFVVTDKSGKEGSVNLMQYFPDIHYYDYTKIYVRAINSVKNPTFPKNYHLTYSFSEINFDSVLKALQNGLGVAVPFDDSLGYSTQQDGWIGKDKMILPEKWFGYRVVDGDRFDIRFMDRDFYGIPKGEGYIVGLRVKGNAQKKLKRDPYGFIQYAKLYAEASASELAEHKQRMMEISKKRMQKALASGFFVSKPTLANFLDVHGKL